MGGYHPPAGHENICGSDVWLWICVSVGCRGRQPLQILYVFVILCEGAHCAPLQIGSSHFGVCLMMAEGGSYDLISDFYFLLTVILITECGLCLWFIRGRSESAPT